MRRAVIGVPVTAAFAIGFAANAWAANPPTGVFQGIINGTSVWTRLRLGTQRGRGLLQSKHDPEWQADRSGRKLGLLQRDRRLEDLGAKRLQVQSAQCESHPEPYPFVERRVRPQRHGAYRPDGSQPPGALQGPLGPEHDPVRWLHSNQRRLMRQRQAVLAHEEGRLTSIRLVFRPVLRVSGVRA